MQPIVPRETDIDLALAALIRQQRHAATFCARCGKVGTVYGADHVTLLCGRCAIIEWGGTPDDE